MRILTETKTETLKAQANYIRKQAEPIWEAIEDHERDQRAFESSLVHLEQQRLCITVMGEFNTGKSTLLNAFVGEPLLQTDQLECTAVPTWVRWDDDEALNENRQINVIYANGESKSVALSEVGVYTTLDQDSWEAIERVEITLPVGGDGRPNGLVFVDTPGLNGNPELEARSIHQLGMSHVTIVVVPVDGIGRKSDTKLIKKARSIADRVMVVINKCDQYVKTGDGFEKFREELRRRIPDLPHEDIYTLSAKRAFDGDAYRDDEKEIKNEFCRFISDLQQNALEDPTSALQKRPLLLLREICKEKIARIKKLEAESDTEVSKEVEVAKAQLEEIATTLERSREEILQLARKTLMGELSILQHFLTEEQSAIEREMTRFVDGLDAKFLDQDDLDAARNRVSERLSKIMQRSIFDRISRLLRASANRLIYDLENRGRNKVSAPDLSRVAPIKLNMAALKQQANKASEALSRCKNEIEVMKQEVERCEWAMQKRKARADTLRRQSAQLENLEVQLKEAVTNRERLGPKPNPEEVYYTTYVTKEVERGGFFGFFLDLVHTKTEKVKVKRQRKDYSCVRKWECKFEAADKKVSDLEQKIAPLKEMRTEMEKIEGELPKLQREVDKAQSDLRRAKARLAEERKRYRQAGMKTRQAQLKTGVRRELKSIFDSLPERLEREAEQMLEGISRDFSTRFKEAADRQHKLLADEMERRKTKAHTEDAERVKREGVRKTLETFLSEDQGERT